ncbi:hypothetical protein BST81_02665 [Leptolyngbya sp. 'hensonii']|uniref:J domain-containing protein n=1 Tax=Leptolyngbya sp. 'hensonii' TaxID=1922337 RepID=UPI00094FB3AE|nr:J domain-containing protein [Leptolyngbya sp. 'hensonii']OLP19994.1 hypothetical protein BST81_02665 [Leptolyngbya sp. 'hensonii']
MAFELYHTLDISPQAAPDEIKKAYYRLVRKYSPEKEPERFKQIREAYETLSDPKAKQNYDDLQQHGEEIDQFLRQAEDHIQQSEWEKAIRLLKRVLVLLPGSEAARNRLGICYIHSQQWEQAIKVYEALTRHSPEVPLYWFNFGAIYDRWALSLKDKDEQNERPHLYQQARDYYQKAIALETFNAEPYLAIAETYLDQSQYSESITWAERAMEADGQIDYSDFEALIFICKVYLYSNELKGIETIARRIQSLLPDSEDARKYAANRFAALGYDLAKAGLNNASVPLLQAAMSFIESARRFDPNDQGIQKLHWNVAEIIRGFKQYEVLKEDTQIVHSLKRLSALCMMATLGYAEATEVDKLYGDIFVEMRYFPEAAILSSVRRIRSQYPAIYRLNKTLFDEIETGMTGRLPTPAPARAAPTGSAQRSAGRGPTPKPPSLSQGKLQRLWAGIGLMGFGVFLFMIMGGSWFGFFCFIVGFGLMLGNR